MTSKIQPSAGDEDLLTASATGRAARGTKLRRARAGGDQGGSRASIDNQEGYGSCRWEWWDWGGWAPTWSGA
jgi:hypothetical protein